MSSIYIQEPPTHGKVLLKTNFGELDIELWSREAPKASRNFIQLCLEGFYNGIIFHRVVKNFIAQTGDPTGTGCTSVSVYGAPFKDEIHSRLRFSRRGLVACANNGKDDNGSQFFFTLNATPELQGKHTIFGKVAGDTLYNLLKLDEVLVDKDDRPVYVQKIIKTKVLNNPFPDIVPRQLSVPKEPTELKEGKKKKEKDSGVKNFKLLSFGDEAEEDEIETTTETTKYSRKIKSTHDVLNDPKLSSKTIIDEENFEEVKDKAMEELKAIKSKLSNKGKSKTTKTENVQNDTELAEDNYFERQRNKEKNHKLEKIRNEIKKLKREYRDQQKVKTAEEEIKKKKITEKSDVLKDYEKEQEKYLMIHNKITAMKGESREKFTLSFMKQFKEKLENTRNTESEEIPTTSYADVNEDDFNSLEWMKGQLVTEEKTVLAKDANTKSDDWYEIYDPRNPITKRRRENSKHYSREKRKSKYDLK